MRTKKFESIYLKIDNAISQLYSSFGFVDRHIERLVELGISAQEWCDAEPPIYWSTTDRQSGFTAHPRYPEVAEALGLVDIWEQRGAPDHCEKLDGQWVCE